MHITLRQLEIFRAVANNKSLVAVSEIMHISQPAISIALSSLERQLGPLFNRQHGVRLMINDSGRALLERASYIIDLVHDIETEIKNNNGLSGGVIKLIATPNIGNYIIPGALLAYKKQYPKLNSELMINNLKEVKNKLLNFEVDIAFVEGVCVHPALVNYHWKTIDLVIICHPDHPLANQTVAFSQLNNENWLLQEVGSSLRNIFDSEIASYLKSMNVLLEVNRTEALKQSVYLGYGLALVAKCVVEDDLSTKRLAVIQLSDKKLEQYFYLTYHKEKFLGTSLKRFIALLLETDIDQLPF